MRLERRKDTALAFLFHEDANPRLDLLQPEVRAKELHDELEFAAGGWHDVDVTPYVITVPEDFRIHYTVMDWDYIWKKISEQNPEHTHNYLLVEGGGGSATVAGMADLSGPYGWVGSGGQRVRVHEKGHMDGYPHDGRNGYVYGGPTRMGHGQWGFHAIDLATTGFFDPVEGNGYYHMVFPDTRTDDVKLVTTDTFRLTLIRQGRPQLYIYRPGRGGVNWVEEDLEVGEKSTRFPVEFVRYYQGYAEVNVGGAAQKPAPEWVTDPQSAIEQSKAGIWHNWDHTHQGFLIDVHWNVVLQEWRALFYWFTYGEGGQKRWFWGTGAIDGNVTRMKIHTTYGRQERPVGEALIYFTDDRHSVIQYYLTDNDFLLRGRGRIELEKLADKGDSPLCGLFDFVEQDREGIFVTDNGKHVYWFGYDGDQQAWFLGDQGKLYAPIGGFPLISTKSDLQRMGSYDLQVNENTGKFITVGDTFKLKRLV